MSKAVSDVLGRIQGNLLALQGMMIKLTPPQGLPAAPNTTFEQQQFPQPPAPLPNAEDYNYAKRLTEDIKGLCQSASDHIDNELRVAAPAPAAAPAAEASSSSQSSVGASSTKK